MTETGTRIGPYRVVAKIGGGGMGEVYRAHDTKLGRDVAIKVLPAAMADDADRRRRFEREARLLAALQHPHIAMIFGVEELQGRLAIVMELVEGATLAERIEGVKAKGSGLPVKEALAIAVQLADALDAAHERGIVHRDLKPANIKLAHDGAVKVLDFGLATAVASAAGDPGTTPTQLVSQPGTIVGTAAYMSPEQARGQSVDKRSDIWAFGCVLYEMLAGKPAFGGDTASDVLANILQKEPAWNALPAATPASVKRLITRCLEKDQRRRLRDIGDVRADLDGVAAGPEDASSGQGGSRARPVASWLIAIVAVAAAAGAAAWRLKPPPVAVPLAPVTRFSVVPPEGIPPLIESRLAVSPDGQHIVFVSGNNGVPSLYVRDVGQFGSTLIPGTDGADHPSISPDGTAVAFAADRKIKKVLFAGGEPVVLWEASVGLGLSWAADGNIYFNPGPSYGISRVPSTGGVAVPVTKLRDGEVEHRFPELLPDGVTLLYATPPLGARESSEQIFAESLRTGQRTLVGTGRNPHYLASGHLLFEREGVFYSAPFDVGQLKLTGPPAIALQGVYLTPLQSPQLAVSGGTVAYLPAGAGDDQELLAWVDRNGEERATGLSGRGFNQPRLSPDGHRIAVAVAPPNATAANPADLWLYDLDRHTFGRLTSDGGLMPVWTPDGRGLTYAGRRSAPTDIFTRAWDGSAPDRVVLKGRQGSSFPLSWSPDGAKLAIVGVSASGGNDLWIVNAAGTTAPLVQTPFREGAPAFSPDGKLFAYVSDASGRDEIYVRPVSGGGQEVLVSTAGGTEPVWPRHGRELFFRQGEAVFAVEIATAPLRVGTPRRVIERTYKRSNAVWPNYDVTSDGSRLLMITGSGRVAQSQYNVIVNWTPPR